VRGIEETSAIRVVTGIAACQEDGESLVTPPHHNHLRERVGVRGTKETSAIRVVTVPKKHSPQPDRTAQARSLRREATPPEKVLWSLLRAGQIGGLKFRRQQPIGPFVVDFYCHKAKLVIELDGMSHRDRAEYDARRTRYLENLGLDVFRVTNDDIREDSEAVARGIAQAAGVRFG
jgi:very-short-patch-repair endonuclease